MNVLLCPLELFSTEILPKKLKIKFQMNWKTVFEKMTGESFIIMTKHFKEEYLNEMYSEGVDF